VLPRVTPQRARVLLALEEAMGRRIVGKDDAIERISRVIRVRMAQLDFRPQRPNGSFLLVGPTGVGKNELAYATSEALFGTEQRVVSVDLGEIAEEANIIRLGVCPVPGTNNQYIEGLLTSPVRRDPEAVILLRGLERAHASFYPILQQILEHGRMDDAMGPISFSQAIIFVTTRPRREDLPAGEIGFGRATQAPHEAVRRHLEKTFSSELLEEFNEIIELPALTSDAVRRIARYKVEAVLQRLHQRHQQIVVAENVFESMIPEEQVQADGAASLHRTLEDRLFNPLARYLLAHRGRRAIQVEMIDGRLQIQERPRRSSVAPS